MSVDSEEIQVAVVVEIEEPDAETHQIPGRQFDFVEGRDLLEERIVIQVEGKILNVQIGDRNVGQAVSIEVGHIGSHAGLGRPVLIESHTHIEADLFERTVPEILEQVVPLRIVRDVDVDPSIPVEVPGDHSEALSGISGDSRLFADIGECASSVIPVEQVREPVVNLGRAIGSNALLEPRSADSIVAEVVVEVPGDIEIQVPVVVEIQECRACRPAPVPGHSGVVGSVFKRPVPLIRIQDIASFEVGDQEVFVPVAVVIRHGSPLSVTLAGPDSCCAGLVAESSLSQISVEGVPDR